MYPWINWIGPCRGTQGAKIGGRVYIAEPLAQGPQFKLSVSFNDETEVRAKAYDAIMSLRRPRIWAPL